MTGLFDLFQTTLSNGMLAVSGLLVLNLALAIWRAEEGFETDTDFYFGVADQPAFEI